MSIQYNKQKMRSILESKSKIDALIHQQHHRQAQRHGLSLEQFHLLIEMDELMLDIPADDAGLAIGRIASHTGNAQNTISERITRLEEKNLVQRIRDANDRRISRVTITEKGREMIDTISKEASSSLCQNALEVLVDDEVDQLQDLLKKILVSLQAKVNEKNGF
jgi:DNA-binding MarR family transcriptional regulator